MFTSVTPHPVSPADGAQRSGLARFWHQMGPGSRKRHARARVESQWLAALRCQWQQACQHVGLGLTIHTPSGYTVSVPRIARVDFGPPVSFTVHLRPAKNCLSARTCLRYRNGSRASSRISDNESKTTSDGLTFSTC